MCYSYSSLGEGGWYVSRVRAYVFLCFLWGHVAQGARPFEHSFPKRGKARECSKSLEEVPVVLLARCVSYDKNGNCFRANGNVLLLQGGRSIKADEIVYYEERDEVFAKGNISLQQENGDILFADCIRMTGDLKHGFLKRVRALSAARESLSSLTTYRYDNKEEFNLVSYTPCERCKDNLNDDPLWAVYAKQIVRDGNKGIVEYTDAKVEFLGIPFLYIPYFFHPTKRKSGILVPEISVTPELGVYGSLPIYWAPAEDKDLLITPYVSAKGGGMLAMEGRYIFDEGMVLLKGSVNKTKEIIEKAYHGKDPETLADRYRFYKTPEWRGYANLDLGYNASPHWRVRASEWWVSDKKFFYTRPFFGHESDSYLQSRSAVQGFYEKHFFEIYTLHYQGLRDNDVQGTMPVIAPGINYYYQSDPFDWGGTCVFRADSMSMYRKLGNRYQRGCIDGSFVQPIKLAQGMRCVVIASLRQDLYWTVINDKSLNLVEGRHYQGRFCPQAGLFWQWPLFFPQVSGILTPTVLFAVLPKTENPPTIPNEDSRALEFTDAVLLSSGAYPARDVVAEVTRVCYGVQYETRGRELGRLKCFLGQAYLLTQFPRRLQPLGITFGFSDVVGSVMTSLYKGMLNMSYQFRFKDKNLRPHFHDVAFDVGPDAFRVFGNYIYYMRRARSGDPLSFEQLFLAGESRFLKFWSLRVFAIYNFRDTSLGTVLGASSGEIDPGLAPVIPNPSRYNKRGFFDRGIGIRFENECFLFEVNVRQPLFSGPSIATRKPAFGFSFYLKTVGGIKRKYGLHDRFPERGHLQKEIPSNDSGGLYGRAAFD